MYLLHASLSTTTADVVIQNDAGSAFVGLAGAQVYQNVRQVVPPIRTAQGFNPQLSQATAYVTVDSRPEDMVLDIYGGIDGDGLVFTTPFEMLWRTLASGPQAGQCRRRADTVGNSTRIGWGLSPTPDGAVDYNLYKAAALIDYIAHPRQQSAAVGATATFEVDAGTTRQWQSAPSNGVLSNAPGTWANISGATSRSYTTGALTAADNGTWYRVTLDGTPSNPARLFITGLGVTGKGSM